MDANNKDVIAGVAAALVAMGVIVGYIYALSHIFRYSLEGTTLNIQMLGLTVRRVQVADIREVEIINRADTIPFSRSFRSDLLFAQRWGGYKTRELVLQKRHGIIKKLIISPDDPEGFLMLLSNASLSGGDGGLTIRGRRP